MDSVRHHLISIQGLNSSTLSEDLIDAFLEFLNTTPLKEETVAQADRLSRKYAAQGVGLMAHTRQGE